ncbi:MAG: histidine kinase dimerization/phospho-acceptor domain-containing protein, partial [Cellulomonas sp.]
MSATASTASEVPAHGDLFVPWLVLATGCYWLMWLWPGDETIPYHIAWAAFALMYGLGNWTLRRAITGLAVGTVATGVTFVSRASSGVITWQETAEIPLMSLLMVLMVVHVRRRQLALAAVTVMAEREREQAQDRERLTRLTSHELRTPLTIARGYVELLLAREVDPHQRRDLEVVDDELERLTRVTERLVRVIRLQGDAVVERVDANAVLRQTADRWAPVAPRRWVVEAHAGVYDGSAER